MADISIIAIQVRLGNVIDLKQGGPTRSYKPANYSGFRSYGSIACMFVIMGAFPRLEDVQERADGAVEAVGELVSPSTPWP